jgi:hypothetical protein
MKPTYAALKRHHYSSDVRHPSFVDAPGLYEEIGYDLDKLIEQNEGYKNTCAVRLSLALIKTGVPFHGRLRIKSGPHKDKMIEPGASSSLISLPAASCWEDRRYSSRLMHTSR